VDVSGYNTGPSILSVYYDGTDDTCGTSTTLTTTGPSAFDSIETDRVFGNTVDDTAAAEMNYEYNCNNNIVLARDDVPFDALSGAYLESDFGTGALLTPGGPAVTTVSQSALQEMRKLGVQTVYVLGGNQALTDAIVNQLQSTPSYNCGGTTARANGQTLQVIRIFGPTADGTAAAVANYVGTPDNWDFAGAYSGVYNDTPGAESASAPKNTNLATAIVATDGGWQDAVSAGPGSYSGFMPVLLTPQASLGTDAAAALVNLGIQQVIVMGGTDAVSDAVVTQLEGMGITVLRVAGIDFTDTSQLFARFFQDTTTNTNGDDNGLDMGDSDINVSRGDYFGDALAGAVIGGNEDEPVLLTFDPNTLGQYLTAYLNSAGMPGGVDGNIGDNQYQVILGGAFAVSAATVQNDLNAVSAGNNA
jgi:putative cell wall-binding protein